MVCCPNSFDVSTSNLRSVKNDSTWRKCRVHRKFYQCIEWMTLISYGIGLWAALCAIDRHQSEVPNAENRHITTLERNILNETSYFAAAVNRRNPWDGWNFRITGISIEASTITCLLLLMTYLQRHSGEKSVKSVRKISIMTKLHEHLSSTIQRLNDERVELKTDAQLDDLSCNRVTGDDFVGDAATKSTASSTRVISASNVQIAELSAGDTIRIGRIVSQCMPSSDGRTMKPRIISSSTAFQKFLLNLPRVRQSCPCYT